MKIAIFSDVFLDISGGIVTSIRAQKIELERLGNEVTIFSCGLPKKADELKKLAKENIFVVPTCKLFKPQGIPIARRPAVIERWILKNFPNFKDFDVVHINYEAGCSIAGIRLAKRFGMPIVQTMHGREDVGVEDLVPKGLRTFVASSLNRFHSWYLPHQTKIKKDNNLAFTRARAKMWTLMVNHANQANVVITPSKHFKEKLISYGVTRPFEVVSNGLEDDMFLKTKPRVLEPGKKIEIIWNSRLSKEKRVMEFLQALKLVTVPYHVTMYGDGEKQNEVEKFIADNNLNVTMMGSMERNKILEKAQDYHLSATVSYHFDNQPMTMIEARAMGIPVLFCDPDLAEIVPASASVLTPTPAPESIAEAINELYEKPEKITEMSKVMIEKRDGVKQSALAQKLMTIYESAGKK